MDRFGNLRLASSCAQSKQGKIMVVEFDKANRTPLRKLFKDYWCMAA
jgi:hypothetical protein